MKKLILIWALVSALLIAGCGGGGGSSSGGGGGGGSTTGRLNAFITDSMSDYAQVWVTINKVELVKSDATRVTVLGGAAPLTVNLTTLRDGTGGLFKMLNSLDIPKTTYTGLVFTVNKALVVFPNGATTGQNRSFPNSLDAGAGTSAIPVNFASATSLGNDDNLIIDFDLANWNDDGTVVTPVLAKKDDNSVSDPARHAGDDYKGTVSNLTSGGFTLTFAGGGAFAVTISAATEIFSDNGTPNVALSNGAIVEVRGTYSTTSRALVATSIKLDDSLDPDVKVHGIPVDFDDSTGRITVEISEARGFFPTADSIVIQPATGAKYLNDAGAPITAIEFAELMFLGELEAEGSVSGGVFTATKLKLDDIADDDGGGKNEARGLASDANLDAGTFRIRLNEWFGFAGTMNQLVTVQTSASTIFEDGDGNELTDAEFFDAITSTSEIKVKGTYNGTTFTATRAIFKD